MQQVKIWFRLNPDEDGYPPFSSESVWASEVQIGRYELENIPFCARTAALGDIVSADDVDGILWFRAVEVASDNSVIRVFVQSGRDKLVDALTQRAVRVEIANDRLIALSVPPKMLGPVRAMLRIFRDQDILGFEEAIIRGPTNPE